METITETSPWIETIEGQTLFKYLIPEARRDLRAKGAVVAFAENELIVAEGDLSPSFFIVLDGTVQVHVRQEDKDVYICSLGASSLFGEASLFSRKLRTASVSSIDGAVIFKLTRYDVMTFLRAWPAEGNKVLLFLINGLMKKLREANQELAFERRADSNQLDVDALIAELTE